MTTQFCFRASLIAVAVLAVAAPTRAAPMFTSVASFERPPRQPMAPLLFVPADGDLYGTTSIGGAHDLGTVFRLNPITGRTQTLVSFTGRTGSSKGENPDAALILGRDGAIYGVTISGGAGDYGTVFRVTLDGGFSTVVEFTGDTGAAPGAVPNGLVIGIDSAFYGTTQAGGNRDLGTVFRLTANGLLTTLANFTGTTGMRKGSTPIGKLIAGGATLFGVTQTGGDDDYGTVFKITTDGTLTNLANFTGESGNRRGSYPAAGLCLHPNGFLYGTTEYGGVEDFGTVFRISANGIFATVLDFDDDNGGEPAGALIVGADQVLYGTTSSGGTDGGGTIFRLSAAGSHAIAISFTGPNGEAPRAGLIIGMDGKFYGTTSSGGVTEDGTCFVFDGNEGLSTVTEFTNPNGWGVAGGPTFDPDGDMLVPMARGGAMGGGTLLRITTSGDISVATEFGGTLGREPAGELVRLGDRFLGLTRAGGNTDRGTLFGYSQSAGSQTLATFSASRGSAPQGPPAVGQDGCVYVVAREGGADRNGAIIRLFPDDSPLTLINFSGVDGVTPGAQPIGPLVAAPDGNFYGVTERGGRHDLGTIFQMTPDGFQTVLVEFGPSPLPNRPEGALVSDADGNLCGTTRFGGVANQGTVFRVTPSGELTVLISFTGQFGAAPGAHPKSQLLTARDGTLYGTTTESGANGRGTVFRLSPAGDYTVLANFTGVDGARPGSEATGQMQFGPDGVLYGATEDGGPGGGGTIYRISGIGPHVATAKAGFAPGVVTLRARLETGGEPTTVVFDYGTSPKVVTAKNAVTATSDEVAVNLEGLAPGTMIFYRARATNASGSSIGGIKSFVVPSPFVAWKIQTFGDATINDLDDTDTDGATNLAEYSLVTGGNRPDRAEFPSTLLRSYLDGRRLSLMLRRDPLRDDVSVAVQASTLLEGPWVTIASSIRGKPFAGPGYVSGEGASPGIKTVEIRDPEISTGFPSRFLRVEITH